MTPTPEFLAKRKAAIIADLRLKVEAEDWHGVADCCMDLREVEAMLKVLAPLWVSTQPDIPVRAWRDALGAAAETNVGVEGFLSPTPPFRR